jgi:hypothetical protein
MKHGFKRMCIVYERLGAKVCFFIYAIMYILLWWLVEMDELVDYGYDHTDGQLI